MPDSVNACLCSTSKVEFLYCSVLFMEVEHALDSKTGDFKYANQMLFGVILAITLLQLTRKVFLKQISHIVDADR